MNVSRIRLENFKRFQDLAVQARNLLTQDVADCFLVLGGNGVGKTPGLPALAPCLSPASGAIRNVADFKWPRWGPERHEKWGRPRVEIEVIFSPDENTGRTVKPAEIDIGIAAPRSPEKTC